MMVPHPSKSIISLTGVGVHDDISASLFVAPRDPNARWDDAGFDNRDPDLAESFQQVQLQVKSDVMFHDSCFLLLNRFMPVDQFVLERLYQVCRSLPYPLVGTTLSWGHDYGGLVRIDDENYFPWEDRYFDREFNAPEPPYSSDPVDASEALEILRAEPTSPPKTVRVEAMSSNDETTGKIAPIAHDPLCALPTEICYCIAAELPTADFLNARVASRALWPAFHNQSFWKTRFMHPSNEGDRSWLFETRDAPTTTDWRFLYHCTCDNKISDTLRNRKRIWQLLRSIPQVLYLHWSELSTSAPEDSTACVVASAKLRPLRRTGREGFEEGCRITLTRRLSFPQHISTFTAYQVRFCDGTYISGLKFVDAEGHAYEVGYRSPLYASSTFDNTLKGFVVAAGARGLRSIQLVGSDDATTDWLGDPSKSPKTKRLISTNRSITGVEAGFDGCKLLSLATLSLAKGELQSQEQQDIQASAFWYPEIPGSALYMNSSPVLYIPRLLESYEPIFWSHFGGPAGIRLRHLTGIGVLHGGGVEQFHFFYDSSSVPATNLILGLRRANSRAKMIHFPIDGSGGEMIEQVDLLYLQPKVTSNAEVEDSLPDRGDFLTCKLTTNWGRSCLFRPESRSLDNTRLYPVHVQPGTTITGFYAEQHPELNYGTTILGVVSEKISSN
ncbi:hypothetical protein QQS21_008737 [Conoideocrella luteorostrata]|uniref:DUF7600 domain-containing protein n=1 Tax=Conoideocrella luteorostrata TaxID=1105319 RepID=A0AAJ0FR48_9HYPO|nr:hypothetical protein QQS21_008737 [Conoideocrella luteorostrata]